MSRVGPGSRSLTTIRVLCASLSALATVQEAHQGGSPPHWEVSTSPAAAAVTGWAQSVPEVCRTPRFGHGSKLPFPIQFYHYEQDHFNAISMSIWQQSQNLEGCSGEWLGFLQTRACLKKNLCTV